MINRAIESLLQKKGVVQHDALDPEELAKLQSEHQLSIPQAHAQVLMLSNGFEVYWGYFRLYGINSTNSVDAITWNRPDYWKFAWNGRCADYWCFAGTVWGDQYAYSLRDMQNGQYTVYFLDALSMSPEAIAPSFEEYFKNEFLRCAEMPYDDMIVRARKVHGPVGPESHLVYTPSPLLGGAEHIDNAQRMDSRLAMICNGDIAVQFDEAADDSVLDRLETYEDEERRVRFRLVWT